MKIVALDYHTLNPGDIDDTSIRSLGDFNEYPNSSSKEGIARAQGAEVVIVNKYVMSRTVIEQLPTLKYICVSATGYNNVDIEAAKEHGVIVSNVSGYSTTSVVQQVYSLLLASSNSVARYNTEVSNNEWSNQSFFSYWHQPIVELHGKTMGLLGYGDIAQAVAKVAVAFGMNVVVHHPNKLDAYPDGVQWVTWDELLLQSDYISLHAPLNRGTQDIINTSSLNKMRSTAVLVNTARGPLVSEAALYDALHAGVIKAACLDVMCQEPPQADHPLYSLDNCIITPHQAWASIESRQRLLDGLVHNINGYKSGEIKNKIC